MLISLEFQMDKSWIEITDRRRPEFRKGVDDFLAFAFANLKTENIRCPCLKCNNCNFKTLDGVRFDLYIHGIVPGYTRWIHHGEDTYELSTQSDDELDETNEGDDGMHDLIYDLFGNGNSDTRADGEFAEHTENLPNLDIDKLFGLLSDAKQELYPGCTKFSKLSFIVNLLHIKCRGGVSDKVFDWLLELLNNAFPDGNKLPKSLYEAKKIVRDLGLNYVKIDACENDCMLYWKEYVNAQQCHVCGLSRWRSDNKISRKILRYFPLKPRLQRLFMSRETAEDMRWHKNERKNDGIMRHPSDSKAWKHFDEQHERFSLDPRNVRLGLASDGFNPFGSPNVSHSTWPVVLVPYNLPPWKCLKQPFFMMTLLIPGPKSPGNDIDVYLQPLIEELKELWEVGIETYDAFAKEKFQLHAAVLWTISDFPAYANLSGWSTRGKLACPCCNKETCHRSLASSGKQSFMGHRRFLPRNHIWRDDAENFDKTVENKDGPKNKMWDILQDKFQIPNETWVVEAINKQLKESYRNFRHRLHKHFLKFRTLDEARKNVPKSLGVKEDDWKFLVLYFSSDGFKKSSARNKANRMKQKMNHSSGTISFARMYWNMRDPETGQLPSRSKLWEETHFNKSMGTWVDDYSREVMEEVEKLKSQSQKEGSPTMTEDEMFAIVLGEKPGYIRGLGAGPKPKSKQSHELLEKRAEELAAQVQSLQAQMQTEVQSQVQSQVQAEVAELKAQMQVDMQAQMAAFMEQVKKQMQQPLNPLL